MKKNSKDFSFQASDRAVWIEFPQQKVEISLVSLLGQNNLPLVPKDKDTWLLTFYQKGFDVEKAGEYEEQIEMFCKITPSNTQIDFVPEINGAIRCFSGEDFENTQDNIEEITEMLMDDPTNITEALNPVHHIHLHDDKVHQRFKTIRQLLSTIDGLYEELKDLQQTWTKQALEAEEFWQKQLETSLKHAQSNRNDLAKKRSQHLLRLSENDSSSKQIQTIKIDDNEL